MTPSDLPMEIRREPGYSELINTIPELSDEGIDFEKFIEGIEKKYLLKALEKANGVKTEAAKLLHLSFRSFRHRLRKYGIK